MNKIVKEGKPLVNAEAQLAKLTTQATDFDTKQLLIKKTPTRPGIKSTADLLQKAIAVHRKGRLLEAKALYQQILVNDPGHFDGLHLLGALENQLKNPNLAVELIRKAITINSKVAAAHSNLGSALHESKKLEDAVVSYDKAIELEPNLAEAHSNRGNALLELNRYQAALESYDKALSIKPHHIKALLNRGNALKKLQRHEESLASYDKVISLDPDFIEAHSNRGNALQELKRFSEAIQSYQVAIEKSPNYFEAHYNLGNCLVELKLFNEAVISFDKALSINPHLIQSEHNKGNALKAIKEIDQALLSYEKTLLFAPDTEFLLGTVLHTRYSLCSWEGFDESSEKIATGLKQGKCVTPSFPYLAINDSLKLQKLAAEIYTKEKYPIDASLNEIRKKNRALNSRDTRIRIAYYSADFHNHATTALIAQLFEVHDSSKFELFGFSFGPDITDEMRIRVKDNFDHFYDVSSQTDQSIAEFSRSQGIDIAVDLKGFTQDSRPRIFAYRCAPIQVSYLGYPGTMGAPYIDYIIADQVLIPEDSQEHYSEKVVYLPHSYQVNDSKRMISDKEFTKSEVGLPEFGFVFCCFNNNYKITPSTFHLWMRILKAVEGSVLWLLEDNPTASINLREEAQARGIDKNRLVFAQRLPQAEHLARHRLADLFIDTLPYNAHTTASDALWTGLPVLTLMGESFAARVAASLLTAIELPELITSTSEEYEAKAIELASDPKLIFELKEKLLRNRLTTPLFNTPLFTKHIESGYQAMYERYQSGLTPDHIHVKDLSSSFQATHQTIDAKPADIALDKSVVEYKNKLFEALELDEEIQVLDIGASAINEAPVYKTLLDKGYAHLHAFEGDIRQVERIKKVYAKRCTIHNDFLFDGTEQTLYLASTESGMTSLLKPREDALKFFNGFSAFGNIEQKELVQTIRLDDTQNLPYVDFVKLDIQGAELTVLKNATEKIKHCLAIQLEVSYICLYENQPSFGDVDVWMRSQGYVPHCFLEVKRWSIAPTIFNGNFRVPGNQLLESDVVYIRDPLNLGLLSKQQLIKFVAIAHHCLKSFDLCIYLLLELIQRGDISADMRKIYLDHKNKQLD